MSKRTIYVVDDDQTIRGYLSAFLSTRGYTVECFETGERMLTHVSEESAPGLVLLDVLMPDSDGVETIGKLRASGSNVPVIMLSGVSHIRTVVESMQMGASDFLLKPFDEEALESAINEAFEENKSVIEQVPSRRMPVANAAQSEFVTRNPKMLRLREIIKRVAYTDVPILILGESGVGKEIMAQYAHLHSGRKDKPFVKVNCAALPADLLESELFGYERGAFTGALNDKPGKFELAHTGTILMDEIGEMSPHLQSKLLHVLQDGTYMRLGGRKEIRVDARIVASTNIKLEDAIAQGKFREDLYYRLNVVQINLPPLRERPDDIPQLCNYFVAKYQQKYNSPHDELPAALSAFFRQYAWPGNIRELENLIKRFLVVGDAESIVTELSAAPEVSGAVPVIHPSRMSLLNVGADASELAQRELVHKTLLETRGNRKKAARQMSISYKALLNKLKRWGVDDRRQPHAADNAA